MRCGTRRSGREQMPELGLLGLEIVRVLWRLGRNDGDAILDVEAVPLEPDQLARIVGEDAHRPQPEIEQDLCADAVVAQVGAEAERLVGLDRVLPLVLELVRLELVEQPDAAPLLVEVDDDTASLAT